MALNIFNEFFASSGSVQSKSAFGHIKRYKEENNIPDEHIRFHFKPSKAENTLFFLTLDTWSELDPGHVNFIIQNLATGNVVNPKIILDTTMEDFVGQQFYDVIYMLAQAGVPSDKIIILTSQPQTQNFKNEFFLNDFKTIHYDMFATAYFNFANDQNLWREIKPRVLEKHLICFMKRPRLLRLIANGIMRAKDYDKKAHYSWHFDYNETRDLFGFRQNIKAFERIKALKLKGTEGIVDIFDGNYIEKQIYDSIEGNLEWIVDPYVADTGGVNLPMETHRKLDTSVMFEEHIKIVDNSFFTEKTYKNFVYGLPFVGFGIPNYESRLNSRGYQCWDNFFETKVDESNYYSALGSHIELLDELCNMPLADLQEKLNSKESIEMLESNQRMFKLQHEIKGLITALNCIEEVW